MYVVLIVLKPPTSTFKLTSFAANNKNGSIARPFVPVSSVSFAIALSIINSTLSSVTTSLAAFIASGVEALSTFISSATVLFVVTLLILFKSKLAADILFTPALSSSILTPSGKDLVNLFSAID